MSILVFEPLTCSESSSKTGARMSVSSCESFDKAGMAIDGIKVLPSVGYADRAFSCSVVSIHQNVERRNGIQVLCSVVLSCEEKRREVW